MEELWHFIEKFEIGTGKTAVALCGVTSKDFGDKRGLVGTNEIRFVTCEKCKRLYGITINRRYDTGFHESEISFRVRKVSGELYGYEWLAGGEWYHTEPSLLFVKAVNGMFTGDGLIRQQWTTFTDVSEKKIYVGDVISAGDASNKAAGYVGTAIFDAGCFSLLITKTNNPAYNISSKPPLYDLCNLQIISP